MQYPVVIKKTGPETYCAYSPDVPGCVATGGSPDRLREDFKDLLKDHLRHTREAGGVVPAPTTLVCTVEVDDEVA